MEGNPARPSGQPTGPLTEGLTVSVGDSLGLQNSADHPHEPGAPRWGRAEGPTQTSVA